MVILAGRSQRRDDTLWSRQQEKFIMTTIESLKSQAKRLRTHLAAQHLTVSHSQALEAIAAAHGFKDWNTASAMLPPSAQPESKSVSPELYPSLDAEVGRSPEMNEALQRVRGLADRHEPGIQPSDEDMAEFREILSDIGRIRAQQE